MSARGGDDEVHMMKYTTFALAIVLTTFFAVFAAAQEKPEDQFKIEPGRSAEDYYNIGNWYSN